jgi:hypothetical protein
MLGRLNTGYFFVFALKDLRYSKTVFGVRIVSSVKQGRWVPLLSSFLSVSFAQDV